MPRSRCSTSTRLSPSQALNSQSSGGRSISEPGRGQRVHRRVHIGFGHHQIDVVLRFRGSVHPQRIAAAEREGHLGGLERRGRPLQCNPELRLLFRLGRATGACDDRYLLSMRLATFNILHGRSVSDGVVDLRPAARRDPHPGRRHPRAAGGRPRPAAVPSGRPDRGRRGGDGGGHPPLRRRAVRDARERPGWRRRRTTCRAPPSYGIALLSRYPGPVLAGAAPAADPGPLPALPAASRAR